MSTPDISKYNRGWRDCQPDMKARRFENMLHRLMVVWVVSMLVIVAVQATRAIKQGVIHEAGQLPTVASNAPKR